MQRAVKRLFDIVFSALALLVLLPVWVVVGLWIALTSKGGVFFRQKRTGYKGRDFDLLKFRSMYVNAEADTAQAADSDRRVTPIGHFLRRSSLDELPQLINVLKGDMSIIGPRPHMLYHTEQYSKLIPGYMRRHEMRPGLTGYAQINGFRGPTPRLEDMENRVRADIYYIDHFSLWLDLKIFTQTIWRMLLLKL
ncbi:MAG: exopolysaccharide biosynthesis polyprenyl glycosylphosphotransferase [Alistipes timonensis]|nr:exopolysaccharide biosynthesis polyprenyl glycosylphosphotransferase [Alistipes timonensis]